MEIRIVLVEPEHPGNIGAAARAMKTMGLEELHLVKPARFPDPQADWRAAGAIDIVANAGVHEDLHSVLKDCGYIVGTTARDRHVPWPILSPEELGQSLVQRQGSELPVAILFGRETNGLTNEELLGCNHHVRIPASETYGSLNLAMAVQIVAYEILKASLDPDFTVEEWDRPLAKSSDVVLMLQHWERVCDRTGFFTEGGSRHAMSRFRRMFNRLELDETEVKLVRGVLSHIERQLNSNSSTNVP